MKHRKNRSAVVALLAVTLVAVSYNQSLVLVGTVQGIGRILDPYSFSFHPTLEEASSRKFADPQDYPFGFSACLLFMDDNMVLPEWIAYHYHFLPLRHLIVGVDPYGATSPDAILDPWRREMGMTIEVWDDSDYCDDKCLRGGPAQKDSMSSHRRLIARQVQFYRRCLESLKEANRTWTTVIDVDEYLVFNHIQPEEDERNNVISESPRSRLPAPGNYSMTAADFIWSESEHFSQYTCHYLPRIFFGPQDSPADANTDTAARAPMGFNATLFLTYRYRVHESWRKNMGLGKSIVDASGYQENDAISAHRALKARCSGMTFHTVAFRVQHYIGSLEAYTSRPGDHRRSEESYLRSLSKFSPQGSNNDIRGWFLAFAEKVGEDRAIKLMQHAIIHSLKQAREMKMGINNGDSYNKGSAVS